MSSSTSSSERPPAWWRFLAALAASAAVSSAIVYLFVVLVDPWGRLPLHLPIPRVPISTNARFSFPALAVSDRFDAAVIGSSTSRLLQPAVLDPLFGARFVNLAMNAATPWEQGEMLRLFARTHPQARAVMLGLDQSWCRAGPDAPRLTGRAFPGWMYGDATWRGYLSMFNLYAVQEAANQFAAAAGFKKKHYGIDGYTNFLPPDSAYDGRRVAAIVASWGPVSDAPPAAGIRRLPYVEDLGELLATLPPAALRIVWFPPPMAAQLGRPGSAVAADWEACKTKAVASLRRLPNVLVVDFARPSAITLRADNYWDPLHYRIGIAARIVDDLAAASRHGAADARGDDRVLLDTRASH